MIKKRNVHKLESRPLAAAVLALLTGACWWVWMAWDHSYQTDSATGTVSGPYQAWQVIGCVVCLVALGIAATARLPARFVVPIMSLMFTAVWSWTATSSDDSGLWVVGALLVFVGMLVGTGVVSGLTNAVRPRKTLATAGSKAA